MKAAKTASPPPKVVVGAMKKVQPALEMKPLGMGNAKMVGALTLKAPVVVARKLKDSAAILENQALRAVMNGPITRKRVRPF